MELRPFSSSSTGGLPFFPIAQSSASLHVPFSTTITPALTPPMTPIPGIPNLPPKLLQKIINWEYIDLSELLPEQLNQSITSITSTVVILPESTYNTQCRQKNQIQNIASWVQVFSTYMLALSTKFPESLPELIAYQLLIVQHSRYSSWLHYDIEFHRWGAQTKARKWSEINPQCYALAFTGQGSSFWCPISQVDRGSHTMDCPRFSQIAYGPRLALTPQRQVSQPLLPSQPLIHSPPALSPPPQQKHSNPDHCLLYNKKDGNCPYGLDCKFKHRCSMCHTEGHPVSRCLNNTQFNHSS